MSEESKAKEVNIDLDIAQNAHIHHIKVIADKLGIHADELEYYGKYKSLKSIYLIKTQPFLQPPKIVTI